MRRDVLFIFILVLFSSLLFLNSESRVSALDPDDDPDGDGYSGNFSRPGDENFTNLEEYLNGTNPLDNDTDDDGCLDGWEVRWGFDPTDGTDGSEDPDGDGFTNYQEFLRDTNPLEADDTDRDGMPDSWEKLHGFDPRDPSDASEDADNDALTNLEEYLNGTEPKNWDTDNDGMPDGWEVEHTLNPLVKDGKEDTDRGGVPNYGEYLNGTDPLEPGDDLGYTGNRGGGNGGYGIPETRVLVVDTGTTRWSVKEWDAFLQFNEKRKRWQSLDALDRYYKMYVANGSLVELKMKTGEDYRKLYYLVLNISSKKGEVVAIPSPSPGAEVIYYSYNETNGTALTFYKDGAHNYYISPNKDENATLYLIFGVNDSYNWDGVVPENLTLAQIPEEAKVPLPAKVKNIVFDMLKNNLSGTELEGLNQEDRIGNILNNLVSYFTNFSIRDEQGNYDVPNPDQGLDLYETIILNRVGAGRHRAFAFFVTANALGLPTRYISNEVHAFVEVYIPFTEEYSDLNWRSIDLGGMPVISENEPMPPALAEEETKIKVVNWSREVSKGKMIYLNISIEDSSTNPLAYYPFEIGMNDSQGRFINMDIFNTDSEGRARVEVAVPDEVPYGENHLLIKTLNFSRYRGSEKYILVGVHSETKFLDLTPSSAQNGTTLAVTGYLLEQGGLGVNSEWVYLFFDDEFVDFDLTSSNGFYSINLTLSHTPGNHNIKLKFNGTEYLNSSTFVKRFLVKEEFTNLEIEVNPDEVVSGDNTTVYGNISGKDGERISNGTLEIFIESLSVKKVNLSEVLAPNKTSFQIEIVVPTQLRTGNHTLTVLYSSPPSSIYPDAQDTATIKIRALQTEILLNQMIGKSGEVISIEGYLVSNDQGVSGKRVEIFWDGVSIGNATTDSEGYFTLPYNVPRTARGEYLVEAYFYQELPYGESSNTTTFFIYMRTYLNITFNSHPDFNVTRGENISLAGSLTNISNEIISGYNIDLYINGEYNTTLSTGSSIFNFSYHVSQQHPLGKMEFRFVFESQDYFLGDEKSLSFYIWTRPILNLSYHPSWLNSGDQISITGNLTVENGTPLNSFSVFCEFNGNIYQNTTFNGEFQFFISTPANIQVGNYLVSLFTVKNGYHLQANTSFNLKIMRETHLDIKKKEVRRNSTVTIEGYIYDMTGKGLEGSQIEISVDGSQVGFTESGTNGYFSLSYFISASHPLGEMYITLTFNSTEFYHGNTTSVAYEVWSYPSIVVTSNQRVFRDNFTVAGQVLDDLGAPLVGEQISIEVKREKEKFSVETEEKGDFYLNISELTDTHLWERGPLALNFTLPQEGYRKEAGLTQLFYLFAFVRFDLVSKPDYVDHQEPFEIKSHVRDEYGVKLNLTLNFSLANYSKFIKSKNGELNATLTLPSDTPSGRQNLFVTTPYAEAEFVFPFYKNITLFVREDVQFTLLRNFVIRGEQSYLNGILLNERGEPVLEKDITLNLSGEVYHTTTEENGSFHFSFLLSQDTPVGVTDAVLKFNGSFDGEKGYQDKEYVFPIYVLARTKIVVETTEGHYLNILFKGKVVDINEKAREEEKTPLNLSVLVEFNNQSFGLKKLKNGFVLTSHVLGHLPYNLSFSGLDLSGKEDVFFSSQPNSFYLSSNTSDTIFVYGYLRPHFDVESVVEVFDQLQIKVYLDHDLDEKVVTHTRLYYDSLKEENLISSFFSNEINFSWRVSSKLGAGEHTLILVEDEEYLNTEFYRAVENTFPFQLIQRSHFVVERRRFGSYLNIKGEVLDKRNVSVEFSELNLEEDEAPILLFINGIQANLTMENPFNFSVDLNKVYGVVDFTLFFKGDENYLPSYFNFTEVVGVDTRVRLTVAEKLTYREIFEITVRVEDIHGLSVKNVPIYIRIGNETDKNAYKITAITKADGTYRSSLRFVFKYDVPLVVYFNGTYVNGTMLYNSSFTNTTIFYYKPEKPMSSQEKVVYIFFKYSLYIALGVGALALYIWKRKHLSLSLEARLNRAFLEKKDELTIRELIIRAYKQVRYHLLKKNIFRNPSETVREFGERVRQTINLSEKGLGRLSFLFEWVDYSKDEPGKKDGISALESLKTVEKELKLR